MGDHLVLASISECTHEPFFWVSVALELLVRVVSTKLLNLFWLGVIVKTKHKLNVFNNIASLSFKYKHNRRLTSTHFFIGKLSLSLRQSYKTQQ